MDNTTNNFKINGNINKKIAQELGLEVTETNDELIKYDQPKTYGLSNCNVIIPSYYGLHTSPEKIQNINYLSMIKDDIKNLRPLNQYQIDYIKKLPHEDKDEIIDIFNSCMNTYIYALGHL